MPVVVCDTDVTIVSYRILQNLRAAIAHLATSMMAESAVTNLHDLYRSGVLLDDEKRLFNVSFKKTVFFFQKDSSTVGFWWGGSCNGVSTVV